MYGQYDGSLFSLQMPESVEDDCFVLECFNPDLGDSVNGRILCGGIPTFPLV
jgi:hypothetical protein